MNLPTKITISRIVLIPIVILFCCLRSVFSYYYVPMAVLFWIAVMTDFIDGKLARKNGLVTDIGKFLDPIADKMLTVAGIMIVIDIGAFYLPYYALVTVTIILSREFIIGVFRQIAASKGLVLAADKLGKYKTATTFSALTFLMLTPCNASNQIVGEVFWWIGIIEFTIATILTAVSGLHYIIKNKAVLTGESKEN